MTKLRTARAVGVGAGTGLLLFLVLAGCAGPIASTPGAEPEGSRPAYGVITPQQAKELIEEHREDPQFVLLDIRTDPEIEAGHISGTTSLDFYGPAFRDELAKLDRSKTYLIYCRTGNRTGKAYAMMENLDFDRVYDMGGGITAWQSLGYPICIGSLENPHVCVVRPEGSGDDSLLSQTACCLPPTFPAS